MSRYLLAVSHEPGVHAAGAAYQSEEDLQTAFARVGAFNESLQRSGAFVDACGLEAPETATIVRAGAAPAPGPLNDAGWQLGGFWVVEAGDDDAARQLAQQAAEACGQTIELRKMQG